MKYCCDYWPGLDYGLFGCLSVHFFLCSGSELTMLHDSRLARFHLYHVGNNITTKSEQAEPNFQSCSLPPDLAGAEFQSFPWKERGQQRSDLKRSPWKWLLCCILTEHLSVSLFAFLITFFTCAMRDLKWLCGKDKPAFFSLRVSWKVYRKCLTLKYKNTEGVDEHGFLWFRLH